MDNLCPNSQNLIAKRLKEPKWNSKWSPPGSDTFFQNPPQIIYAFGSCFQHVDCEKFGNDVYVIIHMLLVPGNRKEHLLLDLTPHGFSKADFESVIISHNPAFDGHRSIRAHSEILDSTSKIKICPSNC